MEGGARERRQEEERSRQSGKVGIFLITAQLNLAIKVNSVKHALGMQRESKGGMKQSPFA